MKFNPTLKEFMENKPNLTIIGLIWAGWWRLYLIIMGVSVSIAILGSVFN